MICNITFDTFKRGFLKGIKTLLKLLKFMIPVYVVVQILYASGVLANISNFCAPAMEIWGLPGETSLTILVGAFVSMTGSLGTLVDVQLTVVQATTLAIIVSTSHNLFAECAIVGEMGMNPVLSAAVRIVCSLLCGYTYYMIFGC